MSQTKVDFGQMDSVRDWTTQVALGGVLLMLVIWEMPQKRKGHFRAEPHEVWLTLPPGRSGEGLGQVWAVNKDHRWWPSVTVIFFLQVINTEKLYVWWLSKHYRFILSLRCDHHQYKKTKYWWIRTVSPSDHHAIQDLSLEDPRARPQMLTSMKCFGLLLLTALMLCLLWLCFPPRKANYVQSSQNLKNQKKGLYSKNGFIWHLLVVVQSLSCVQLFCNPWTVAHQAPLSMGFPR